VDFLLIVFCFFPLDWRVLAAAASGAPMTNSHAVPSARAKARPSQDTMSMSMSLYNRGCVHHIGRDCSEKRAWQAAVCSFSSASSCPGQLLLGGQPDFVLEDAPRRAFAFTLR
jgi:hypothetical protein